MENQYHWYWWIDNINRNKCTESKVVLKSTQTLLSAWELPILWKGKISIVRVWLQKYPLWECGKVSIVRIEIELKREYIPLWIIQLSLGFDLALSKIILYTSTGMYFTFWEILLQWIIILQILKANTWLILNLTSLLVCSGSNLFEPVSSTIKR